jgi:hypothetical protein
MDPFMGSGTVLVEGMLAGITDVYGSDINPFAVYLSTVKTNRLDISELQTEVNELYDRILDNREINEHKSQNEREHEKPTGFCLLFIKRYSFMPLLGCCRGGCRPRSGICDRCEAYFLLLFHLSHFLSSTS